MGYQIKFSLGLILVLSLFVDRLIDVKGNESFDKDDAVDLTESNFDEFIQSNKIVLVMFYAPWCGHCKNLKPTFSDVARRLNDNPNLVHVQTVLAKVDCTKETALATKYKITGYPTLKFFRNNGNYPYEGPTHSADFMIGYIQSQATSDWKPPVSMVDVLVKSNFSAWVEKHDISLVAFTIPTCVHCQRLEPEFEKAAKALSKDNKKIVHFGKVDCSQEPEFAQTLSINGFPQLYIFRKGRKYEYNGGRQAFEIVEFMEKSMKPTTKEVKSVGDFKSHVKDPIDNYIIGFFNDEADSLYAQYIDFGSKYPEDFKMFHVFDHSDFKENLKFDLKVPSIVVFYHDLVVSSKEPNYRMMDNADANVTEIEDFVFRKSLPLVGVINNSNKKLIYKNIRPICYAFYEVDFGIELRKNTIHYRNKLVPLAKKYKDITFVICNENDHQDLIMQYNLEETKGDVNLLCLNQKSQKFIYDNEDNFDIDEVEEFLEKFLKNKLKPHFKSETEPKDNSKRQIKVLVGSTIESTLEKNKEKNVLIYFFKPDCAECREFEKIYTKLAQKFANDKNLLFTKINRVHNEFPDRFRTDKNPALFLVQTSKDKNEQKLFDYTKESTLKDLIKFVEDNRSSTTATKVEL